VDDFHWLCRYSLLIVLGFSCGKFNKNGNKLNAAAEKACIEAKVLYSLDFVLAVNNNQCCLVRDELWVYCTDLPF
jgi:hypothetical protein